jgi:hypothetical protein
MEHNEVKLILCGHAFSISEMTQAYKRFSHVSEMQTVTYYWVSGVWFKEL